MAHIVHPITWKGISLPTSSLKITKIEMDPNSNDRTLTINRYTDDTFTYDVEQFVVVVTTDHNEASEYYTEVAAQFDGASVVTE